MSMTAAAKDELSKLAVAKPCCQHAETATMLHFAGGLHIVAGRVVIDAVLDAGGTARRLCRAIHDLYGYTPDAQVLTPRRVRQRYHYLVRVVRDGEALAQRCGLLDDRGRPILGLPTPVVAGGPCDAAAIWRGAFLARGTLTAGHRSAAIDIGCPDPEAAMALTRAARRLGITTTTKQGTTPTRVRDLDHVIARDGDAIATLLTRMGAPRARQAWEQRRTEKVRDAPNRLAGTPRARTFDIARVQPQWRL